MLRIPARPLAVCLLLAALVGTSRLAAGQEPIDEGSATAPVPSGGDEEEIVQAADAAPTGETPSAPRPPAVAPLGAGPDARNVVTLDELWIPEGIVEPIPDQFGGFLGIDPEQTPTEAPPGAAGPFDVEPSDEELFSTDDIDRLYARPAPSEGLESLTLERSVRMSLGMNFGLADAARSLASTSSSRRGSQAEFVPFVDLMYDYDYVNDKTQRNRRDQRRQGTEFKEIDTFRQSQTTTNRGGVEARQNLPWGGSVRAAYGEQVVRHRDSRFDSIATDEDGNDVFVQGGDDIDRDYRADISLALEQPLLRGAGWTVGTAGLRQAQLSEMEQSLSFRLRRRDAALSVIRAYYDVARSELDLQVSREALREVVRFMEETQVKLELGRIAESEISRAQIQFLQEKQTYISRLQSYEASVDALLEAIGLPLRAAMGLAPLEGQLVDARLANIPPLEEGIEEALSTRLELAQADISVARSELSIDLAKNDLLPDLNLNANWTSFDEGDNNDQVSSDLEYRRRYDAGLSLVVPLQNLSRREALWRAKLDAESTRNSREQRRRDVVREVKAAYRDLQAAQSRLRILAKTVEQARRSLAQENARFEVGLNTSTEVRNAQDDLFSAQSDYNQALFDAQVQIARVFQALGRPLF
jgi:outer membrane protein TolC